MNLWANWISPMANYFKKRFWYVTIDLFTILPPWLALSIFWLFFAVTLSG
jgi:hypothetical protein